MKSTTLHPMEVAKRVGHGGGGTAREVSFDNSLTELVADNVQSAIEEVADETHHAIDTMTLPDGTVIYMDKHDGKIGYNTDEERGADTFHPFSSGLSPELLWENENPTTTYQVTTLALDLSGYSHIIVELRASTSADNLPRLQNIIPVGFTGWFSLGCNSGTQNNISRYVTEVTNDHIAFGAGRSGGSTSNSNGIPVAIYGINL